MHFSELNKQCDPCLFKLEGIFMGWAVITAGSLAKGVHTKAQSVTCIYTYTLILQVLSHTDHSQVTNMPKYCKIK